MGETTNSWSKSGLFLGNPFTDPCWGSCDFILNQILCSDFKIFQWSLVFQTYKFQMFYWCADFKYGCNRGTKWNMLGWYRGGLADFIAASYWNWRMQLDVNRGIEMRNQEISRSNPINSIVLVGKKGIVIMYHNGLTITSINRTTVFFS